MKSKILILLLVVLVLSFTACAKPISEVKSEDYLNLKVTVKGTVLNTIKFGDLSGYTIEDNNGDSIFVSSDALPAEDSTKRVKGTVKKTILGYYIETKE